MDADTLSENPIMAIQPTQLLGVATLTGHGPQDEQDLDPDLFAVGL